MTDAEIMDFLVVTLEGNNAKRFSDKTGITTPVVSRIRSGELRLKTRYDQILAAYPMLNKEWLMTGEGYPGDLSVELVRDRMQKLLADKDKVIQILSDEIKVQQKVIEKLMRGK